MEEKVDYGTRLEEIKDVFDLYDKDKDGAINTWELSNLFNAVGLFPDNFDGIKKKLDSSGSVKWEAFSQEAETILYEFETEGSLLEAFRPFDPHDTGKIAVEELRYAVTHFGCDCLSEEEADDYISEAKPDEMGMVDYRDFVKLLLAY